MDIALTEEEIGVKYITSFERMAIEKGRLEGEITLLLRQLEYNIYLKYYRAQDFAFIFRQGYLAYYA